MMNRILLALDGSDHDEAAFLEAQRLAGRGSEIHFVHVVPSPAVPVGTPLMGMGASGQAGPVAAGADGADAHLSGAFPASYPETSPVLDSQIQDRAGRYLAEFRKRSGGFAGQDLVWTGSPADAILEVALKFDVDMIVLSARRRSRFARWVLGSVSDEVLNRSQLPVLLVRQQAPPRAHRLRRLLVPLDGTPASRAILSAVKPLAARLGAEILLLEVVEPEVPWHGAGNVCHDLTVCGASWQFAMVHGNATEKILGHALSRHADMIAMSVSARGGDSLLDERVAEALLDRSGLPVLLQHPVIHAVRRGGRR